MDYKSTKSGHSDDFNSSDSEWGLEIVIKSTPKKSRRRSIDPNDQKIIDEVEKNIEETLEEKAAKSNLSHSTVKSILKHVFTDEHVLALVKQKEGCEDVEGIIPYEPKITRSKAKELYSNSGTAIPLHWNPTVPPSEVQALLNEDLQEDSSGDEYVPGEESEDDASFSCSISNPPTPSLRAETPNSSFLEEEVFKTPQTKGTKSEKHTKEANIALRTRSKLSLSQTPLEKIEQAFIPPDITTDMYEMDCNNDDWKEFLKAFAQPLEDAVKNTEDEDHDPEYNILSDEEINEVDKEELREDKAVKVPKKELNDLMAELFEYVDIYSQQTEDRMECESTTKLSDQAIHNCINILDTTHVGSASAKDCQIVPHDQQKENMRDSEIKDGPTESINDAFSQSQLLLLEQQMRQHVQMLVQYYLLIYQHPFYAEFATTMKEYLINLKLLSQLNEREENSVFYSSNLKGGLELIEKWERKYEEKNAESLETIEHFQNVMDESVSLHAKGENYHLPFPPLILKIISESDVFIYPYLLPRIPFKHPKLLENDVTPFQNSEYQLVALGLEQFSSYCMENNEFLTKKKTPNKRKMSEFISSLMMPARKPAQVYRQMLNKKKSENLPNPIAYYEMHKKAPLTLHQVYPLNFFGVVPPKMRPTQLLPRQWRDFLSSLEKEPNKKDENTDFNPKPALIFNHPKKEKPPKLLKNLVAKSGTSEKNNIGELIKDLKEKKYINSSQKVKEKSVRSFKRKFLMHFRNTVSYSQYYSLRNEINSSTDQGIEVNYLIMLPSMPCLNVSEKSELKIENNVSGDKPPLDDSDCKLNIKQGVISTDLAQVPCFQDDPNKTLEKVQNIVPKDNIEDINALMVASSSVKIIKEKRELSSLADKKRAKRRKEYLASIAMLAPPDPIIEKDRREQFAQAYYDKLKETLDVTDYDKVVHLFLNVRPGKDNTIDLYRKLTPILLPKYKDLADEFLLFLNDEQANAVGKLIPFFILNHMSKFLRNLEIYFKDQPAQLRKIHRSLMELNDSTDATLDKIKTVILPLLKGSPLLCDGFLQIFLEESPPATLLNGAWEVIDVNKEINKPEQESVFESVTLADNEDSTVCACSCHKIDEQQPLKQHCINCGLRFVQGKIYCQTAKGLKPVKISFPFDKEIDHNARLAAQSKISPNKRNLSPSKDSQEENRESEEDDKRKNVKGCKSPKKSKPKPNKKLNTLTKEKNSTNNKSLKVESPKKSNEKMANLKTSPRKNRTKSLKMPELPGKDNLKSDSETKCQSVKPVEVSEVDIKNAPSPEFMFIPSSDSEISQDELNEMNKKDIYSGRDEIIWNREEDKIILETFQQKFDEEAIQLIAQRLKNRSVVEIKTRFERLMALLQEMECT